MTFTANNLTFNHIDETYISGLAKDDGEAEYVVLQRRSVDDSDDWGVHLEISDQLLSDYNLIKECSVYREKVEFILKDTSNVITVKLDVTDELYETFLNGLKKIFRNFQNLLIIN